MPTGMIEAIKNFKTARWLSYLIKYGVYTIFVLMIILFSFTNKNFLTVHNFMLLLQQAAPHGIAVIGVTFVLIVAGVDISIGRNMYVSAVIVAIAIERLAPSELFNSVFGYIVIFLITISTGVAVGAFNGVMVARFKIVPFIATLATGSIIRGIGLIASNSKVYNPDTLSPISNGYLGVIPNVVIIFVVLLIVFDYILRRTPYGRHIMAIGNDLNAAQKAGISVKKNIMVAYIICGGLAALGGVLSAGQVGNVAVYFAEGNEFIVISAAVLGGTSLYGGKGSVFPGALIGILLIYTIMNGMAMIGASPYVYTIFRGVVIFLAVMMDSFSYKGELR